MALLTSGGLGWERESLAKQKGKNIDLGQGRALGEELGLGLPKVPLCSLFLGWASLQPGLGGGCG